MTYYVSRWALNSTNSTHYVFTSASLFICDSHYGQCHLVSAVKVRKICFIVHIWQNKCVICCLVRYWDFITYLIWNELWDIINLDMIPHFTSDDICIVFCKSESVATWCVYDCFVFRLQLNNCVNYSKAQLIVVFYVYCWRFSYGFHQSLAYIWSGFYAFCLWKWQSWLEVFTAPATLLANFMEY